VCELAELPPGGVVRVEGPEPIAVFNVEGELLAVGDTCTHEDASLSEGWREGTVIECPYHMARFCLRTGRPLCLPATEALPTYGVVVIDGVVWVEL
jgi:3-phenylpropionate/trans-cinnamate dioxygenase ferredoxin subunit